MHISVLFWKDNTWAPIFRFEFAVVRFISLAQRFVLNPQSDMIKEPTTDVAIIQVQRNIDAKFSLKE